MIMARPLIVLLRLVTFSTLRTFSVLAILLLLLVILVTIRDVAQSKPTGRKKIPPVTTVQVCKRSKKTKNVIMFKAFKFHYYTTKYHDKLSINVFPKLN